MAAFTGVDLDGIDSRSPDAFGVVYCFLIPLDDGNRKSGFQFGNRSAKKRRFAASGTGNQIQCKNVVFFKKSPVFFSGEIVFIEYVDFELY
jgi:hypothetical protein